MRRLAMGALAAALAACEPDIGSGVYYCGPEEACPEGLRCDGVTALCVFPDQVEPFACGAGANDAEPDDDPAAALALGTAGCGGTSIARSGCVDNAVDIDYLALQTGACSAPLGVSVRFPLGFAPLTIEVLDAAGGVLATGEVCDELDDAGQVKVCAETPATDGASYLVRVRLADDAPTCGGACAFNRYQLSLF